MVMFYCLSPTQVLCQMVPLNCASVGSIAWQSLSHNSHGPNETCTEVNCSRCSLGHVSHPQHTFHIQYSYNISLFLCYGGVFVVKHDFIFSLINFRLLGVFLSKSAQKLSQHRPLRLGIVWRLILTSFGFVSRPSWSASYWVRYVRSRYWGAAFCPRAKCC